MLDAALIKINLTYDGPQQSSLSLAVVTHQSDPAFVGYRPGKVLKYLLFTETEADVIDADHNDSLNN